MFTLYGHLISNIHHRNLLSQLCCINWSLGKRSITNAVLSHSVYVSWLQCWHSRVTLVTVMKAYICQRDCLTQTYNNFVFLKWIFFCIPWLRSLTWFPFRQLAHISVNNLRDNTHLYRSQGLYAHSFHFHFLEWLEKHGKLLSDVKTCWNSTLAGKYITAVLSFLIKVRLFISVNNCS